MSRGIADYVCEVLGFKLEPWQRRFLSFRGAALPAPRRSPSRGWVEAMAGSAEAFRDAFEAAQAEWLDRLMPERKVARTVAEWHDRGLLAHRQDTPMFFDIQRMLDLDR